MVRGDGWEGGGLMSGVLCWTVESGSVPILHYALKSNGIGIGGQGSIRSGFKHYIISLLA